MNTKTGVEGELLANRPRAVIRQLVDQLKTAFIMGLLVLWLATLKSAPGTREAYWVFVILSVAVALFWFVWRWKKRHALRGWLPFVMLGVMEGLIWFTYWISGVSTNVLELEIIGYLLLLWAGLLLLALVLVMVGRGTNGKLGKAISKGAEWGNNANAQLSVASLSCSVILGWSRLLNAGYRGWWIVVLLYLGVAMIYIVALAPMFYHNEGGR